jgi:hypothetical protein
MHPFSCNQQFSIFAPNFKTQPMNKLIYLGILTALFSITACNNNDDDNNDPNVLDGSFHAVIDGQNWDAQPDNTGAVVSDFGSGPVLAITGSNETDTTHFFFSIPYFYGNDTVITEPTDDTVLRFQGNGVWDANSATLNVSKTLEDGIETYSGTFNGNFVQFFDSTDVRVVTGGTFTVKRLL